ncbi:hypothetical protein PRIPAC_73075 [Pristionchus pacificus]|nr:hypothetical protein PRIPAC_73075 [Pristionchus pacificus]
MIFEAKESKQKLPMVSIPGFLSSTWSSVMQYLLSLSLRRAHNTSSLVHRMLLFLLFFLPIASALIKYPIAHTPYGSVRGIEYQAGNGFVGEIFKKVPYASPPVVERRWKKPEPPEPWNYTIDGTFAGPACAQVNSTWVGYVTGLSEDCLTLNIFTSKKCRESNGTCPVVVYIHGGSALYSSALHFTDESQVSNFPRQGVILVTMEYRVGIFGVAALGDEHALPANLAVHDVIQSIRFVRSSIHAFGGDKEQITVMGHSIGAGMVLLLLFSPAINKAGEPPLFARAVASSGVMNFEPVVKQVNRTHGVATKLGCEGTAQEIVTCMRGLSTDEIIRAAAEVGGNDLFSETHLSGMTIAGELFPFRDVREMRKQQKDHMNGILPAPPTKLLIGTLFNEFRPSAYFFYKETGFLDLSLNEAIDSLGVRNYNECMTKYFDDWKTGQFKPGYDTLSQGLFVTAAIFGSAQVRAGGEVYLYSLDYPKNTNHADDMYILMGIHEYSMDSNQEWLSRVYPVYFTNFIKGLPLAPDWEPLNPELMNYYSINKSFTDGIVPHMKLGYHQPILEYYANLTTFDENLTKSIQMVANAPVQFKSAPIPRVEPVNTPSIPSDIIVTSLYFALMLLIVVIMCQCCRSARKGAEDIPLKMVA